MTRLHDLAPAQALTLLLYGASGTGKSHFCGTAGSRSIILDIGRSRETLLSPYWKKRFPDSNPDIIPIVPENGLLPDHPRAFDAVCRTLDDLLKSKVDHFDTVAIDDSTALRSMAMKKGLVLNSDRSRTKGYQISKEHGVVLPEIGDYGTEMSLIEQFVAYYTDAFVSSSKNLILVAHERITYNRPSSIGEPPTVRRIGPAFTGQTFPDQITAYFDSVWQSSLRRSGPKSDFCLRTIGDATVVAKTRHAGVLGGVEVDPNFSLIWERMKGSASPP